MGQTDRTGRPVATLAELRPTRTARALAGVFAVGLVGVSLAVAPAAGRVEPITRGLVVTTAVIITLADLFTGYLLWVQARVIHATRLAVLGGAYVGTSFLVTGNALLFRHIGADGAAWLWLFWHAYFTGGVIAYAATGVRRAGGGPTGAGHVGPVFAASAALGLLVLGFVATGLLPAVMRGATLFLSPWGKASLFIWTLTPVLILAARQRTGTVLDLWLLVTMIGMLCEVGLVLTDPVRYGYGWSVARGLSLVAALTVFGAFFYEMNRIYVRLLRAQEHLADAHVDLLAANTQLSLMLDHDELTQVLSRRGLLRTLRECMAQGAQSVAVLMVDLDRFKQINDRLGHLGGDLVLREVGRRIKGALRATDVVGRYGGDEFVVVLPQATRDNARAVAGKIVSSLRRQPVRVGSEDVAVTASIGVADARPGEAAEDLLRRADEALYQAKEGGRDDIAHG